MRIMLVILALALLCAGCITDSGDTATDLIGRWNMLNGSYHLTFRADGSYSSPVWGDGNYTASGNHLTLRIPAAGTVPQRERRFEYRQNGDFLSLIEPIENGVKYYDYQRQR